MKFFNYSKVAYGVASAVAAVSLLGGASLAQAATLTSVQVQAIINLLQVFSADQATIINVQSALIGQVTNTTPASMLSASTTNDGTVIQFTIRLRRGMNGEDVKHLQEILASDSDIFSHEAVTGFFGPKTEKALKHFQKRFGIDQVGSVGPKTMEKLNELLDEHHVHTGEDINDDEFGDLGDAHDTQSDEHGHSDNWHTSSTTTSSTTPTMRHDQRDN